MAAAAEAATVTVRLLPTVAIAASPAALPALATAQAGHEGGVFAVQLQCQSVQWSVTRSYVDVLRLHAQIISSNSTVLALEPPPLAVQCTDENQRQWAALTTATDGKEHDVDDVITDPAELEAYLKTLLASDLSPASKVRMRACEVVGSVGGARSPGGPPYARARGYTCSVRCSSSSSSAPRPRRCRPWGPSSSRPPSPSAQAVGALSGACGLCTCSAFF